MSSETLPKDSKPKMPQIGEAVFSIAYLLFDLIAAIIFFANARGRLAIQLFGILTLILGGGDAFHLVPRVIRTFRGDSPKTQWWTGLGLLVSSVTMTIFYVLLFYVWKAIFPETAYPAALLIITWVSAVLRILLCFFPQNNWFDPKGNPKWGIYRNLPFAVTGLCLVILFFLSPSTGGYGLWQMSVAILISFACYFPVVLWGKKKPMVGMLMIPKTLAYVWMIGLGLSLINRL